MTLKTHKPVKVKDAKALSALVADRRSLVAVTPTIGAEVNRREAMRFYKRAVAAGETVSAMQTFDSVVLVVGD